jgi:hypothetical protein
MGRHSAISPVTDYVTQVLAVVDAELRKLRHDPMELLSRAGSARSVAGGRGLCARPRPRHQN